MAEFGIPITLATARGTITFNDIGNPAGYLRLTGRDGADGGAVRTDITDLPNRDGSQVNPAYESAVYEVLAGEIVAPDTSSRLALEDELRSYAYSLLRADGMLSWLPSGAVAYRQRTVRLSDQLIIQGGLVKEFQLSLVAADPLAYSDGQTDAYSGYFDLTNQPSLGPVDLWLFTGQAVGASGHFATNGNESTYPLIRIWGPVAQPTLTKQATGEKLAFTDVLVYTHDPFLLWQQVPADAFLEIDCRAQTCKLSTGGLVDVYLNAGSSKFFALDPGDNYITLTAPTTGAYTPAPDPARTRFELIYRDAWHG